jgi:hypothetical protein
MHIMKMGSKSIKVGVGVVVDASLLLSHQDAADGMKRCE